MSNFDSIQRYFEKGWNPFPLPPKKKRFPPTGYTGRQGQKVTQEAIDVWRNEHPADCNVGLHLTACTAPVDDGFGGTSPEEMQLIGIDVDNYAVKVGGKELSMLEEKLGPLPKTIISTARTDGTSGIRLFLAPKGLAFKGKPGGRDVGFDCDSIEIIQHKHRYVVAYPSVHPDGGQYKFYQPGAKLDGNGLKAIPAVRLLAHLPDAWVDHLTAGRQVEGDVALDMDSTDDEVLHWYNTELDSPLGSDREAKPCDWMMEVLAKWRARVADPIDSHTPLQMGHWHLLNEAYEGHNGIGPAMKLFNDAFMKCVDENKKRNRFEAQAEMARSFIGALRRIKGQCELDAAQGFTRLSPELCSCEDDWGDDGTAGGVSGLIPGGPATRANTTHGSEQYERNEKGNATHLLDVFGKGLNWVPNYATGSNRGEGGKWLVLDEDTGIRHVDLDETRIYEMFDEIQKRQVADAREMYEAAANSAITLGLVNNAGVPSNTAEVADAKAWKAWANDNGNELRVTRSLNMAKRRKDITVRFEALDSDPHIIAVGNGILRFHDRTDFDSDGPVMEWVDSTDGVIVTQTTGHPFIPLADQREANGPEIQAFDEFLETFIKQHISSDAYTYLHRFLGYSLLGHNRHKQALFLVGKPHTGKTTFQTMIVNALGKLAIWRDPNIFQDTGFKDPLAAALARRIVCLGEIGDTKIDVSLFKRVVGGDEVSCNIKNVSEPVTLAARCTIISGCNDSPNIPGLDEATRDRMAVVPFLHKVTDEERNPKKQAYLEQHCQTAVLAWLIEGLCDALTFGVGEPPAEVRMARQQFVEESSELAVFAGETLEKASPELHSRYRFRSADDPRNEATKDKWPDEWAVGDRTLYKIYQSWCQANGVEKPMPKPQFTKRLGGLGFTQDGTWNKHKEKRWVAVKLTSGVMQVQG